MFDHQQLITTMAIQRRDTFSARAARWRLFSRKR
jgi:hypothetical protein